MKIIGVIPVRYESQRFPGKPLAIFKGKTILEHVYNCVKKSNVLDEVIIATDNKLIEEKAKEIGARVVITPKECSNGTERVGYAAKDIEADIIVNIQGDQPVLPCEIIEETVKVLLEQDDLEVATPICTLDKNKVNDKNTVKVVKDKDNYALYFSRFPVPYMMDNAGGEEIYFKHIGIYAYRKKFLMQYRELSRGILEKAERLEQLRVLENGHRIMTVFTEYDSPSVDTAEDLENLSSL